MAYDSIIDIIIFFNIKLGYILLFFFFVITENNQYIYYVHNQYLLNQIYLIYYLHLSVMNEYIFDVPLALNLQILSKPSFFYLMYLNFIL